MEKLEAKENNKIVWENTTLKKASGLIRKKKIQEKSEEINEF